MLRKVVAICIGASGFLFMFLLSAYAPLLRGPDYLIRVLLYSLFGSLVFAESCEVAAMVVKA